MQAIFGMTFNTAPQEAQDTPNSIAHVVHHEQITWIAVGDERGKVGTLPDGFYHFTMRNRLL